jgi:hypothetical protein
MRLTLRTLLAYLDGNLEADDAKDIAKKIEESEFATKLVHLIRDCTRRLRLGAPPLLGRGLGGDPNSVAEYLEYRLSDDRVPEFEKICFDSEVELAEVASCHQILTLVLGEPAEIPVQMRERLYALAAQADAPPQQPPPAPATMKAAVVPPVVPPAPPVVRRPKPEVPEYLRETRWRWWPVAALVLAAATLTFAGLLLFGPSQLRERVRSLAGAPQETAPAEGEDAAKQDDHKSAPPKEMPSPAPATDAAKETERPVVAPQKPAGEDPTAPPAPEPSEPKPAGPRSEDAARPSEPAGAPPAKELAKPAADGGLDDTPAPSPPAEAPPENSPPPDAPRPQSPAPRDPPESFGRYTVQIEALLKFDPASGNWLRVPGNSPLSKGDRLLSLPAFRPTIMLSSNITIQADGPALLELVGWTDQHLPILKVDFGRLLMSTVGRADNSLELQIDSRPSLLTFVDAESTLALEVRRELPPGKDPESGPAPLAANVYAATGLIRVRDGDAQPVELRAPARWSLGGGEQPPRADLPPWVNLEEQSGADRSARNAIDGYLESGKPAALQLRELTSSDGGLGRRREVRALAIESLTFLGDFEPCVAAMNTENERFFWPLGMEALQAAVARDPQTAKRLRETFQNKRGAEDGAALYRMLWGYSAADLKAGADRELVEALASDSVDFRVMSSLVLQNLTGKTHGYRPEDREINRRTAYNKWKKEIGRITPRPTPTPAKSRAGKTD